MRRLGFFLGLFLVAVGVHAVPVQAGYGGWTGPDGVLLNGLTWLYSSSAGYYFEYYGKAQTWRQDNSPVYYIRAKAEGWNNCGGYYHKISESSRGLFWTGFVVTPEVYAGSTQCYDQTFVEVKGTHQEVFHYGGPYIVTGHTSERKNLR